jgi:hypothetical protein
LLAGIILPYDTFGSHLNSKGETIDDQLEQKNFQKAGETLAEVWNEAVIDHHPVFAEWRGGVKLEDIDYPDQKWFVDHVKSSQYFLQIVKCDNQECCPPMRSSLKKVIPGGFIPAPLAVINNNGLAVASDDINCKFLSLFQRMALNLDPCGWQKGFKTAPYDICCPTVKGLVPGRTCTICDVYFPSQAMVSLHKKVVHPRIKVNVAPRTRPLRVAAQRQREMMAIIASGIICDFILCAMVLSFINIEQLQYFCIRP